MNTLNITQLPYRDKTHFDKNYSLMYNKIATFYLCVCSLASDFRRTFYLIIKELTLLKRLNTIKYFFFIKCLFHYNQTITYVSRLTIFILYSHSTYMSTLFLKKIKNF